MFRNFLTGLTLLISTLGLAAPIVDQSNIPPGYMASGGLLAGGTSDVGFAVVQTVTAGVEGYLTGVDLLLGPADANLSLFILASPGMAGQTPAGNLSIDPARLPTGAQSIVHINLTSLLLKFEVGDLVGILPTAHPTSSTQTSGVTWWSGVDYAAGQPFTIGYAMGDTTFHDGDLGFRTYVDPGYSPVPEPATWLLLCAGGVAILQQRKQRSSLLFALGCWFSLSRSQARHLPGRAMIRSVLKDTRFSENGGLVDHRIEGRPPTR